MQISSNITFFCLILSLQVLTLNCHQADNLESKPETTTSKTEVATAQVPVETTTSPVVVKPDEPAEEPRDLADQTTQTTTSLSPETTTTTTTTSEPISEDSKGPDEPTTTSTSTTTTTSRPNQTEGSSSDCANDSYCLNGGTCIVYENGQIGCLCPEEFYGARCQTRNICKTLIVDSLTGDNICATINRFCVRSDRFFRCDCHDDEYFVFKADHYQMSSPSSSSSSGATSASTNLADSTKTGDCNKHAQPTIAYDSLPASPPSSSLALDDRSSTLNGPDVSGGHRQQKGGRQSTPEEANRQKSYLAECRRIDKCLGVRCRQMSEVCVDGQCLCNIDLGYMKDPTDSLCKLLDPCRMPPPPGEGPVCGQAKCVATYNRESFKCVCPIGYNPVKKDHHKNSTQCALLTDEICEIPLLNKCQHLCKVDRHAMNTYKCYCLPGYRPGARPGIDDHLCFFEEHLDQLDSSMGPTGDLYGSRSSSSSSSPSAMTYTFRAYLPETLSSKRQQPTRREATNTFGYDGVDAEASTATTTGDESTSRPPLTAGQRFPRNFIIKREAVLGDGDKLAKTRSVASDNQPATGANKMRDYYLDEDEYNLGLMSAQDRCSMYCEDNKICVLEEGTRDSYRCVCDRQGYVSVGDRCLDWCSAAEFSHSVQYRLEQTCLSGICKASDVKPSAIYKQQQRQRQQHQRRRKDNPNGAAKESNGHDDGHDDEMSRLLRESSWRPSFECDCSTSPLLFKDEETKLCKLNFQEILRPCLPGNEGYIDCVVNKNAYCAVLHRPTNVFFRDLQRDQPLDVAAKSATAGDSQPAPAVSSAKSQQENEKAKKARAKEKSYTCVCSPEKKFLVDKPRNKARCIDECDLLNNECGRFNRMCRAATIDPEHVSRDGANWNLVRYDQDGIRMNQFKRTGCECLPGFNVGPSEYVDFFPKDDNELPILPYLQQQQQPPSSSQQVLSGSMGAAPLGPSNSGPFMGSDQSAPFQAELAGDFNGIFSTGPNGVPLRTKYMNINSRCLLDYDVVEFHASFKAPADFEPVWVKIRNTSPLEPGPSQSRPSKQVDPSAESLETTTTTGPTLLKPTESNRYDHQSPSSDQNYCKSSAECLLKVPEFMRASIGEFHKSIVFVAQCDPPLAQLSIEAYRECIRYRYWILQKLRNHFADWRRVMANHLKGTFDLMDGNIRLRVNKCEATIRRLSTVPRAFAESMERPPSPTDKDQTKTTPGAANKLPLQSPSGRHDGLDHHPAAEDEQVSGLEFDPLDQYAVIDADVDCELTIHSASDDSSRRHARKVLLEKQLPKFIFNKLNHADKFGLDYYLMAPSILIQKESFDQLAKHRKAFSPCKSDYAYCDKQTRCEMVDTVNFSCTCEYGYTPIGSRDIYQGDSRLEVCEDIDECLFDVCKENGLENKSICINEIGDYKCRCIAHHIGDNKRYCNHICNVIACKFGDCRIPDEHHAYCECFEGYREADCSVLDPSVALRKANMIICGSIFTSVLLLAITLAISLNSQLKKTKKKLKRLQAANDAAEMFEFPPHQPPFRSRMSKVSVCS